MKLVLVLLVRDEADVVGQMLDFHFAHGVDHVVATDNASRDGTTNLLRGYATEGRLTLLHEPSDTYQQDKWVTRMALVARLNLGADWILPADADEFWSPPEGHDLKSALAEVDADLSVCGRVNLIAARDASENAPWWERLVHRAADPEPLQWAGDPVNGPALARPYFYYSVQDKVAMRAQGLLTVGRGAHSAGYERVPSQDTCGIVIHHVPVRGKAAFADSVARIGRAVRADGTLDRRVSGKYRRWLTMWENTGDIEAAWAEVMPSGAELAQDLTEGRMVEDARLRDAVRGLPAHRGSRASVPAATAAEDAGAPLERLATVVLIPTLPRSQAAAIVAALGIGGAQLPVGAVRQPDASGGDWVAPGLSLVLRELFAAERSTVGAQRDLGGDATLRAALFDAALADYVSLHRAVVDHPFTGYFLDLWRALGEASWLDLRVAIPLPDPVRTATDIAEKTGLPRWMGHLLWLDHMLAVEAGSRGLRRHVVPLPAAGADPGAAAKRITRGLGLDWHAPPEQGPQTGAAHGWGLGDVTRREVFGAEAVPAIVKRGLSALDAAARADRPDALALEFDAIARSFRSAAETLVPDLRRALLGIYSGFR